jgi:hypothetical protein
MKKSCHIYWCRRIVLRFVFPENFFYLLIKRLRKIKYGVYKKQDTVTAKHIFVVQVFTNYTQFRMDIIVIAGILEAVICHELLYYCQVCSFCCMHKPLLYHRVQNII